MKGNINEVVKEDMILRSYVLENLRLSLNYLSDFSLWNFFY